MRILNHTGLLVCWLAGRVRPPAHSLTMVVKGTFDLVPDEAARLAGEDAQDPFSADLFHDDDPEQSCRYDSDFAFFKPRADVTLVGTCHAPGGQPVPACYAGFSVGGLTKRLAVIGDRAWAGGIGSKPTDPAPFATMPLRWERSFGGAEFTPNPYGRGAARVAGADGTPVWPLPNIENPNQYLVSPDQRPAPAGFGPLAASLPQRRSALGTYDDAWAKDRWPGFPEDFDWGYFNAAPRDQQVEGYLTGTEPLRFENLHPELADYRAALPGLRPRLLLNEQREGAEPAFREVPLNLDTLWIDMDAGRLVLVWRGLTEVEGPEALELRDLYLTTEPAAEAARPVEQHVAACQAGLAAPDGEEEEPAPAEPPAEDEGEDEDEDEDEDGAPVGDQVDAMLVQMREQLSNAGVPADVIELFQPGTNPDDLLASLMAKLDVDPDQTARLQQEAHDRLRAQLKEQGLDDALGSGLGDDDEPPAAGTASIRRDDVGDGIAAGRSFAGEDLSGLDLSGLNLSGGDFTDALMDGARLDEANLTGADLSGATLSGISGKKVCLASAKLNGADLTGGQLETANLTEALLDNALFDDANLAGAVLQGARADGASFARANLVEARLEYAKLAGADFSGCGLDQASFKGCVLNEASFEGARGAGVSMAGADLTGVRAGDGCHFPGGQFQEVTAPASTWIDARLAGADFTFADMERADFTGADLAGANLHAVELKQGNLTRANARDAQMTMVNLFQARLERANLTKADLSGSNMFQAEFLDAVIAGTRFEGANLKQTKLADRSFAL